MHHKKHVIAKILKGKLYDSHFIDEETDAKETGLRSWC